MLDTSNLEDHLLNSNAEDKLVLEHDEKADPALIKLIKLTHKQPIKVFLTHLIQFSIDVIHCLNESWNYNIFQCIHTSICHLNHHVQRYE